MFETAWTDGLRHRSCSRRKIAAGAGPQKQRATIILSQSLIINKMAALLLLRQARFRRPFGWCVAILIFISVILTLSSSSSSSSSRRLPFASAFVVVRQTASSVAALSSQKEAEAKYRPTCSILPRSSPSCSSSSSSSALNLFGRFGRWRRRRKEQPQGDQADLSENKNDSTNGSSSTQATTVVTPPVEDDDFVVVLDDGDIGITNTQPLIELSTASRRRKGFPQRDADMVIVGGGISGLAAAITAAEAATSTAINDNNEKSNNQTPPRIVLLEAASKLGGRVASETTKDGYILDEGFAVFIEEYPEVRKLLDYDALQLKPFLAGALVKLRGPDNSRLGRVADPLREPADLLNSILSPVGSLVDKIKVLPLVFHVRVNSVEALFADSETDTLTALKDRWGFSDAFIETFFKPFLEGIYLAPLSEQSSNMFSFVFKMFSEGSATLPYGGMQAVTDQLVARAQDLGVEIETNCPVTRISLNDGDSETYTVECARNERQWKTSSLVVATDGEVAHQLLSNVAGFESLENLPVQPQLAVGCLYYGFQGAAPIDEPILILNGICEDSSVEEFPVNNICFPSVVNKGYAPEGYNLCSVTVLSKAMELYKDRPNELDKAVRRQLGMWFPDRKKAIVDDWELKKIYYIPKAQPSQLKGPFPANVNGGRAANTYRGKDLPNGLFVCGDHMASATLNGAVESGVNAGQEAYTLVASLASKVKQAEAVAA